MMRLGSTGVNLGLWFERVIVKQIEIKAIKRGWRKVKRDD